MMGFGIHYHLYYIKTNEMKTWSAKHNEFSTKAMNSASDQENGMTRTSPKKTETVILKERLFSTVL